MIITNDDLFYQASMSESFFCNEYKEGEAKANEKNGA